MKNMIKCGACGRRRKKGHEKRVGTDKAYSKNCKTYADYKKEIDPIRDEKRAKQREIEKAKQKNN